MPFNFRDLFFLLIDTQNMHAQVEYIHTNVYTTENLYMDVTLDCYNSQGA